MPKHFSQRYDHSLGCDDGWDRNDGGVSVRVTGVTANLPVDDIGAARSFYADFLGLDVEEFNLGWVARFRSADGRASLQLVTHDATSPVDSVLSVHVGDGVDEAYEEAKRRGYEVVHPLTEEPWGVRRFFVRDPDGNVINVVSHRDE
jgi:predicted enzyme related to lactoylglutathione lyase